MTVRRQRKHRLGEGRVVVAVLHPPIADQHEIPGPTTWRRRRSREGQPEFVAGIHDHVSIVDAAEQLAHVSEPRVIADQVAPPRRRVGDPIVNGHFRLIAPVRPSLGKAAITQVGARRRHAHGLQRRVRHAFGPSDPIPVDLEIGAQPQPARPDDAGACDASEIDQDRLVLPRREAQIGRDDHPAALGVLRLERQTARLHHATLADRHVDAAVGRIDPAVRDEPRRGIARNPGAEIDVHVVIRRHALVRAQRERAEIAAVLSRDEIGHVPAGLVRRVHDGFRGPHRRHRERRRLARKSLIDEHVDVPGMVDRHQRDVIDEMGFPQLGADPHVVCAITLGQLVTANPDPVFRLRDAGRVLRVDAQSQRRSPQEVRDEVQPGAIVGEDPGTRALQPPLDQE